MIGKHWAVEGFYCFAGGKLPPEFVCSFWDGMVVWEFGDGALVCYVDGHIEHSVQYMVSPDGLLHIYYPILIPYFYHHIRRYRIVKDPNANVIWLCDTDRTTTMTVDNPAIKLSLAK